MEYDWREGLDGCLSEGGDLDTKMDASCLRDCLIGGFQLCPLVSAGVTRAPFGPWLLLGASCTAAVTMAP